MEPPFYHVDRRGELTVGDELSLRSDWELYHSEGTHQIVSDYKDRVRDDFDNQLSNHGIRYAHSFYEIEQSRSRYCQEGYEKAYVPTNDPTTMLIVDNILQEWVLEYVRRRTENDHLSRFQSYFAYPTERALHNSDNIESDDYPIAKVEPNDFEIKDMSCYSQARSAPIGDWLELADQYWKGKKTKIADLEVQMHPPITVKEIIDC